MKDDRVLWIVYGVQGWDRTKLEMGTGHGMSYTWSTKIMYFSLDSVALGFRDCVLGIYSWNILRNVLA